MTPRENQRLGSKVRLLRKREGITQAELSQKIGISPSYLNLIEADKRPLTAGLLLKLAQLFKADLASFVVTHDVALAEDLSEAVSDPLFEGTNVSSDELKEFATDNPAIARAMLQLYRGYVSARDTAQALASRVSEEGTVTGVDRASLPSEDVGDFIQHASNHFPTLELAAEELVREAGLDGEDPYGGLSRWLAQKHGVQTRIVRVADERKAMRRYDPTSRVLSISEVLPPRSRRFQLAHQIALISLSDALDRIVNEAKELTTHEARSLARVALANYFAAAVLMPYEPFIAAAHAERYDIELLAHRFGASFEQVCHRLTTLRREGREGVPFHLIRIDMAGNISKRFSASGIRIARFSGACPRWNVHAAFLTPGMLRVQVSRMPDGVVYFCLARTLRSDRGGFNVPHTVQAIGMGCDVRHAKQLVYSEGMDLANLESAVPVGVTCRTCDHLECAQRAFPPLLHPIKIQENVRGLSFYAPVDSKR